MNKLLEVWKTLIYTLAKHQARTGVRQLDIQVEFQSLWQGLDYLSWHHLHGTSIF